MPSEIERSAILIGQVAALRAFANALAVLSAGNAALLQHFELSSQATLALLETMIVPDETIQAFQQVCDGLFSGLKSPIGG